MTPLFPITADTRLQDIIDAYPWLKGEAIQLDERFKLLDSPLAKMLIRKATVADASKRTGFPTDQIIAEINKMIDRHAGA
ncbi:MAG: hypothetical protein IJ662_08920 [Clostridia bacterium]|nr:hypothetical protein [Clostridia bacterium]